MDKDFRENASENFANSLLPETLRIDKMDEDFRENVSENFAFGLSPKLLCGEFWSKLSE